MLKFLFSLFLLCVFAASAFLFDRYTKNPDQITPFPYLFKPQTYAELKNTQAPIVILGSAQAQALAQLKSDISKILSQESSTQIDILDLTGPREGMHRSLQKLKLLRRTPLMTIYLGGDGEEREKKFNPKDQTLIDFNLLLFQDLKVRTLFSLWPKASRLVYAPLDFVSLSDEMIPVDPPNLIHEILEQRETYIKLFEIETEQFIETIKSKGALLVMISPAYNLHAAPKMPCSPPPSKTDQLIMKKAFRKIQLKDYKSAYNQLKDLVALYPEHAQIQYLYAVSLLNSGFKARAYNHFLRAQIFNCNPQKANPIYAQILKKIADKNQVTFFDYSKMVYTLGDDQAFITDHHPHSLFYEKLAKSIAFRIKRMMNIK